MHSHAGRQVSFTSISSFSPQQPCGMDITLTLTYRGEDRLREAMSLSGVTQPLKCCIGIRTQPVGPQFPCLWPLHVTASWETKGLVVWGEESIVGAEAMTGDGRKPGVGWERAGERSRYREQHVQKPWKKAMETD